MKIKLFFVLFALISAITVIPRTTGLTVSYADEPTGHTCEECEGSGIRTTSVTCSVCDGIGEIANTSVCDSCGGNPMITLKVYVLRAVARDIFREQYPVLGVAVEL